VHAQTLFDRRRCFFFLLLVVVVVHVTVCDPADRPLGVLGWLLLDSTKEENKATDAVSWHVRVHHGEQMGTWTWSAVRAPGRWTCSRASWRTRTYYYLERRLHRRLHEPRRSANVVLMVSSFSLWKKWRRFFLKLKWRRLASHRYGFQRKTMRRLWWKDQVMLWSPIHARPAAARLSHLRPTHDCRRRLRPPRGHRPLPGDAAASRRPSLLRHRHRWEQARPARKGPCSRTRATGGD
jgi:hypothetical protein